MQAAHAAASGQTTARQLLQQKVGNADSSAAASLWRQFRSFDREASGKLTTSEFAKVLQNSKLGLSNADVLRVANGMADCHGLMDYRPLSHMLQSQVLQKPRPQTASCAKSGAKKPPLGRQSSSLGTPRTSGVAGQTVTAGHAQQASPEVARSAAVDAADVDSHSGNSVDCSGDQSSVSAPQPEQQQPQQPAVSATEATAQQQSYSTAGSDSARAVSGSSRLSAAASGLAKTGSAHTALAGFRAPGPAAQKVPYFFSKGQVNMEQSYKWMPSKDNNAIVDGAPRAPFVRLWTAEDAKKRAQVGNTCRSYLLLYCQSV